MKHLFTSGLLLSGLLLSNSSYAEPTTNSAAPSLKLEYCHLKNIKSQVQCGSLSVPENYQQADGEKIAINIAVLPAIDNSEHKTPLMFLAGGPGQAAVELASTVRTMFREANKTHDIILVDQRGTGKSHPLQCDEQQLNGDAYQNIPESLSEKEISQCIESLNGDLSQYNSANAIRDFDQVRQALGYQKIHLYGGSYGTRAALVYMNMFPDSLATVTLDSVAPMQMKVGMFGQTDADSFNAMLANCQADKSCHENFPNLAQEYQNLRDTLAKQPVTVTINHPRLGTPTKLTLSVGKLYSSLRILLYSVSSHSLLPLVIHQAANSNYLPLSGLIAQSDGGLGMYTGLTFNIVCSEDFPRITPEELANDSNNTFGKEQGSAIFAQVCKQWPKYPVEPSFYQTSQADIPTLVLSGELDPVTPPKFGEMAHQALKNSRHLVVKNSAHIVVGHTCAGKIINQLLDSQDVNNLDVKCLDDAKPTNFMTNLNGSL